MSSRLQTWDMSRLNPILNRKDDASLLKENEVQQLENCVLISNIMAKSRGGIKFHSYIAEGVTRASSGTTRTLVLNPNTAEILLSGDTISIFRSGTPNTDYDIKNVTISSIDYVTNYPNITITYTGASSITETTTADTNIRVARISSNKVLHTCDYFYFESNQKNQLSLSFHQDGSIYKYLATGERTPMVIGTQEVTTIDCTYANLSTGDYITVYTDDHRIEFWLDLTGSDTPPSGSGSADYQIPIDVSGTSTDANLATAIATEINKHSQLTAEAATNTVTITQSLGGTKTAISVTTTGGSPSLSNVTISTTGASLSLSTPLTAVYTANLGNDLLITFSGIGNKPWLLSSTSAIREAINNDYADNDVSGTNDIPDLGPVVIHQDRIFGIDKTDPNRLHYSDIGYPERWNGEGDSGAIDLDSGDNDPNGLLSIMPPFRGQLIVGKGTKQYRIIGEAPLQAKEIISDSLGSVAQHATAVVDQKDVIYISAKGVHSVLTTDKYGDFDNNYLSANIQPDFEKLSKTNLSKAHGVYIPELSSYIMLLQPDFSQENSKIFCVNVEDGRWYYWTITDENIIFETVNKFIYNNSSLLIFGTQDERLFAYDETVTKDFLEDNIKFKLKSGIIYPDKNPRQIVGFKQLGILYETVSEATNFNIEFKIDNQAAQIRNVTNSVAGIDVLGTSFTLGSSTLGADSVILPENINIDGYGFGATLKIESNNYISLSGYLFDYEVAGDSREVNRE